MLVFPAIELLGGRAVRLEQGRETVAGQAGPRRQVHVYSQEPWKLAADFAAAGAPRVHVVDLDADLSAGRENNHATITRIVAASTLEVEVGGGLHTLADCERLFTLGVRYAVLSAAALETPAVVEQACRRFPRRIIVAVAASADALEVGEAVAREGAGAVLYSDPDLAATARLARRIAPCPVIASGAGVARLEDLDATRESGAFAVVIGKPIHERAFTVDQAVRRAFTREL